MSYDLKLENIDTTWFIASIKFWNDYWKVTRDSLLTINTVDIEKFMAFASY